MKIIDKDGIEISDPDLAAGYLINEEETIHHEAVEGVEEQYHWKTIREYPNGGKDVEKVIDVEGAEAHEAYDEKIPVMRYVLYTEDELKKIKEINGQPTIEERLKAAEDALMTMMLGDGPNA